MFDAQGTRLFGAHVLYVFGAKVLRGNKFGIHGKTYHMRGNMRVSENTYGKTYGIYGTCVKHRSVCHAPVWKPVKNKHPSKVNGPSMGSPKWVEIIKHLKLTSKSLKTLHVRVRNPMKSPKSDLFGSTRVSLPV